MIITSLHLYTFPRFIPRDWKERSPHSGQLHARSPSLQGDQTGVDGQASASKEQRPSGEVNSLSARQEIPRILWTWRFIAVFTAARHLSLSWASSIQPTLPQSYSITYEIKFPSASFAAHYVYLPPVYLTGFYYSWNSELPNNLQRNLCHKLKTPIPECSQTDKQDLKHKASFPYCVMNS